MAPRGRKWKETVAAPPQLLRIDAGEFFVCGSDVRAEALSCMTLSQGDDDRFPIYSYLSAPVTERFPAGSASAQMTCRSARGGAQAALLQVFPYLYSQLAKLDAAVQSFSSLAMISL